MGGLGYRSLGCGGLGYGSLDCGSLGCVLVPIEKTYCQACFNHVNKSSFILKVNIVIQALKIFQFGLH